MYDGLRDFSRWVLPEVLKHHAAKRPDAPFVAMTDGDWLTYGQADRDADQVAGFFASLGVKAGDRVVVMVPSSLDFVLLWLGLGRLGAVFTALNTELTGDFLRHQIENSGARTAVFSPGLMPRLQAIAPELKTLRTVVVAGGDAEVPEGFRPVAFDDWKSARPWDGPLPKASDIAAITYTSGTTGPSKGVLLPHAHCYLFGLGKVDAVQMNASDRYYIVLPLFHVNGLLMQLGGTLLTGASAVVRERFSASAWLDDVRRHECTLTNVLGAVAAFVVNQPPSPHDRDHRLRCVMAAPNPAEIERVFRERFGVPVIGGFGMTEVNIPLYGRIDDPAPGTCGRPYERYFEVEIRDPETDAPLPPGVAGEIMVRPKAPFGFMAGYQGMPEKTVEAWRNLWFHTGDAGLMREDGCFVFLDRLKDCIRRRGENISSFEVEAAMQKLDGVREVAAYAVPSDIQGGEDEVMLAVALEDGCGLTCAEIAAHADAALPRYARPRYIEIMAAIPKTSTEKAQKAELRKRGVGPQTWDREAQRTPETAS
jgi:crotonobetaine/carnitine-CoA ligase